MSGRIVVDYSDIDHISITDDQYRTNLYNQIRNASTPNDLTITELERIIDENARRCPEFHL